MAVFEKERIYDAVIAGAGPAGCVLASRLSEDPSKKVLLVEAGPDALPGTEHPDILDAFPLAAAANPQFRWPDLTAETGADPGDGSARMSRPYLQGFGVGGASNINGMGADRGNPGDYDEWCRMGAKGWAWEEVLPYFKKLERDLDFSGPTASLMHGEAGPIPVRRLPRSRWGPFASAIGNAVQRRGFDIIEDYNAEFGEGMSAAPTNSLPDRRVSASMAYLTADVRRRANLQILSNARVDRVSFEHTRATGVLLRVNGAITQILGRQVVVSCGAIQSPVLLMRSGVGPEEHLRKHEIDVVAHLPGVGANLLNHPYLLLPTYLPRSAVQGRDNPWLLQNWLRFSSNHADCDRNDMHLMCFNRCDWHALGRHIGALVIAVFKSYSKGCVELSDGDPLSAPIVRFNLLSDSRDFDRLVSGLRFSLEILTDPIVERARRQIFIPNPSVVASLSQRNRWNRLKASLIATTLNRAPLRSRLLADSLIDPLALLSNQKALCDFVRIYAQPEYHVCGTCRMGDADDTAAVVDSGGKVYGTQALRVVDASIFPTIPRANTHITVIMAAEKVADSIKSEWRRDGLR